jgi:hypothetical protein
VCRSKELFCTLKADTHDVTFSGSVNFYIKLSYSSVIYKGLFLTTGNAKPRTLFQSQEFEVSRGLWDQQCRNVGAYLYIL